ncbi:MAG: hypothetical protein AB1649_31915 [Chloroflexota bacterium]
MDHKKDAFRSTITRRQFLQSAAMGLMAVQFTPKTLVAQQGLEEIRIISGTLANLGEGWLEIRQEERPMRLFINGDTTFWKGGESSPHALMKGDDLMIKALAPRGLALRVWSNLTRVKGRVNRVEKNRYVLRVSDLHTPQAELMLEVSERTIYEDAMTGNLKGKSDGAISEGDYLDAIGEQISEGLRATLVYLYHAQPATFRPETVPQVRAAQLEPFGPYCTYTYSGYASWFNCSTGAGRCETCNTSRSDQAAWPALDTCGCCSPSCCDCSKGCKDQIYLWCGKDVTVLDLCQGWSRTVYIADCGPCQKANCAGCSPETCGRQCSDCRGYVGAVIDLTRPTFAYFYDPASRGCFSCDVKATVLCP